MQRQKYTYNVLSSITQFATFAQHAHLRLYSNCFYMLHSSCIKLLINLNIFALQPSGLHYLYRFTIIDSFMTHFSFLLLFCNKFFSTVLALINRVWKMKFKRHACLETLLRVSRRLQMKWKVCAHVHVFLVSNKKADKIDHFHN